MKKVVGYGLAVFGLLLLVLGAGDFGIPIVSSINGTFVSIVSMVFVGLGVVIIVMSSEGGGKSKGYEGHRRLKGGGKIKDLPVYEGDDIVAYRRD